MFSRRVYFACVAVLAVAVFAVLPGCDWFTASDPGLRQSPFLSSARISPAAVSCGTQFVLSFSYDDPQGDIASVRVSFLRNGDTVPREESPAWPNLVNRTSGTVSFPFTFACGTTGGDWAVTVQVLDLRDHPSNILTTGVKLNAAG